MLTVDDLTVHDNDNVYIGRVQVAEIVCYDGKYTVSFMNTKIYNRKDIDECLEYIVNELNGKF